MPNTAQERNAEMVALLGQDFLSLLDRNHFADYYGSVQNTGIGATPTVLSLNTTRFSTAEGVFFALSSSIVTVSQAGLYRVDYWASVGFDGAYVSEMGGVLYLEEDPSTGTFAEVPGSRIYLNLPASEGVTGSRSLSLRIPAGYRYRLVLQRLFGPNTLRAFANGKGLSLTCLFAVK